VGKWWSLLFGVVILACTLLFVIAPFVGWWLPGGHSTHAGGIDLLFYLILAVTGFFFLLTEGLLVVFMWMFGSKSGPHVEGQPPATPPGHGFAAKITGPLKKYIPDEHRLEMLWTAVPAIILFLLAIGQIPVWAGIKYLSQMPKGEGNQDTPLHVAVSARQFEWRMRYPSPETWKEWKKNPKLAEKWAIQAEFDDIHVVNELHVWTDPDKAKAWEERNASAEDIPATICHLTTLDVQHNLNIPHFRVKQDALPGKNIPVWFRPTKVNCVFKVYNEHKKTWEDGEVRTKENRKNWQEKYGAKKLRWEDGGGWDQYDQPMDKLLVWEIACAELCGRWHYHMTAKVYVHPSEEDFLAWLEYAARKQNVYNRQDLVPAGK
jgi:cytochrome c oxidase subunit 2